MRQLRREGWKIENLMKRYNMKSHQGIMMACNGTHWSHIDNPLTKEEEKQLRHYKKNSLSTEQQEEICLRYANGVSQIRLGKDYGVSNSVIFTIVHKKLDKVK